tara:strand:- start:4116 stop:4769 length:654 start_codon:yes stop_codon:yes gene_type:complete
MTSKETRAERMNKHEAGIFGFGLSNNTHLDILNIVILAFTGIVIKIFFQENFSKDGTVGPASTTIWGYGLTCIALIILIFISFYLIKLSNFSLEKTISVFDYLKFTIRDVLPIFLTLFIIFYIILLNFIFFNRINSNRVTNSYHSYSFISTILIIIQLILIVRYIYVDLDSTPEDKSTPSYLITAALSKNATYILSTINFVFVVILHILLAFFSTDG